MKRRMILPLVLALLVVLSIGSQGNVNAQAGATYWVSPDGEQTDWESCGGETPLSNTAACSLATANANVSPGDTVYLREGTYYPTGRNDCIHPGQSGTPENRIVYVSYNNESVTIDGTDSNYEAILFSAGWDTGNPDDGRSYITVRGIDFANWNKLGEMRYASYNEITDCNFSGHKGDGTDVVYNGFFIYQQSTHNWIHGNTWHTYGHFVEKDGGCLLNVGHDTAGTADNSGNNYNTIENNHFYASGHHVVGVNNAQFNVVRNNYFHNEGWSTTGACSEHATGTCGYRVMSMTDASGLDVAGSNLLENNNIAYGAQYGGPHLITGASGSGLTIDTDENIVRYNKFFGNVLYGIRIGSSIATSTGLDNRIYNNTIYYSGYNLDSWGNVNEDDEYLLDNLRGAFLLYGSACDGTLEDNVIKNNLAHDIWSETNNRSTTIYYPAFFGGATDACNTITNNWGNSGETQSSPFTPYPDPLFVDPDITDPMALTFVDGKWVGNPDLSLQADSPVINQAVHLTQANDSGSNSTTLIVNDAGYFQDGTWGSDLARATLHADWIAIGRVNNVVEISAIDYDANEITLATPMTWSDDAPIWLYKRSDETIVLYGDAPDYGAYEYAPSLTLSGTPADRAIHLTWKVDATLPPTSTWQISYYSQAETLLPPVVGLTNTLRTYTLTELTNGIWYTVTLNATLDSTPFLTDTVTVMPTGQFVYLPLVLKTRTLEVSKQLKDWSSSTNLNCHFHLKNRMRSTEFH